MKTILKDRTEYRDKSKQLHRLDGPAVEYSNGDKFWYVEGNIYSEIEFMHKFYPMKQPEYLKNF